MQVAVYLNRKEAELLAQLGLELGVGGTSLVKAILRKFLIENQFREPSEVAQELKEYLTFHTQLRMR